MWLVVATVPAGIAGASADGPSAVPDPLFDYASETGDEAPLGFPDPFEGLNRFTFRLNLEIDHWVLEPITRGYQYVVPAPGRRAIRRAFVNLNSPVVLANDLLQLEPVDALVTATRFVVNTTLGVAGLIDVASLVHLEGHESDFGQTLALSGVPSGPYLVVPLLGPTNIRDGTGYAIDFLFRPTTYLLTPGGAFVLSSFVESGNQLLLTTILEGSTGLAGGIATREAHGDALEALEVSSIDFYAALRNAYFQTRVAMIWRRGEDRGPLALAKRALGALTLGPPRREVGDLAPHGGDEAVKAVALEH